MKEALLVIDMLSDFVRQGAPLEVPEARSIIPVIKEEMNRTHAAGNPVIYICDSHTADDKNSEEFCVREFNGLMRRSQRRNF